METTEKVMYSSELHIFLVSYKNSLCLLAAWGSNNWKLLTRFKQITPQIKKNCCGRLASFLSQTAGEQFEMFKVCSGIYFDEGNGPNSPIRIE